MEEETTQYSAADIKAVRELADRALALFQKVPNELRKAHPGTAWTARLTRKALQRAIQEANWEKAEFLSTRLEAHAEDLLRGVFIPTDSP